MSASCVRLLGIRHLGPGSARSVVATLQEMQPDCILIEGPPEGQSIIHLVADAGMVPPVSMLIYAPDDPGKAVYYPFANFSPEWQSLLFGLHRNIQLRFIDLPQSNWLAMESSKSVHIDQTQKKEPSEQTEPGADAAEHNDGNKSLVLPENDRLSGEDIRMDPLLWLARAAGYGEAERWWEHMVEHRCDHTDLFQAVKEAMTVLRTEAPEENPDKMEPFREAYMRQSIRAALKEGFKNIAVVCGAWHVPALEDLSGGRQDVALLKGLPRLKVSATWIPWTNSRLTYASGYGAGVSSPGWYQHLWNCNGLVAETWLSRTARLLREADIDASSAHVIESVRLAECLAAMRGRPVAGLEELTEASKSVLCFGSDLPLRLIHNKLIIGEAMGRIPENTPSIPLQKDLERQHRRLRLAVDPDEKLYDLDLRKETDLGRSHLLHRLKILGVEWGRMEETGAQVKGTFHEIWRLRWLPEFSIKVIEAARFGKTVEEAAGNFARELSDKASRLSEFTELLDEVLRAGLPTEYIMQRLHNQAAIASDITDLMNAVPPLCHIARYGNVRKTDVSAVLHIIDGLIARVSAGLPPACVSLNDEAAQSIFNAMRAVNGGLSTLERPDLLLLWHESLGKLAADYSIHGLISGRACRILRDTGRISSAEASRRMGLALSRAANPVQAGNWAEGFLNGSGLVLIHDDELFDVINDWVSSLDAESFTNVLPLLRRTFSNFTKPERRQIGERAASGSGRSAVNRALQGFCSDRADAALDVVAMCLGLDAEIINKGGAASQANQESI